ncbi:helix-turn-helix transcriptional regulator [Thiolapillus sp.]|uniref:helix-turn-helix transcriptional regulator n=1 Tax=Thiolapillus sp. TaxID=2017437 RepID=UPI003AF43338
MALPMLNRNELIRANEWLAKNTVTDYKDIPRNISHAAERLIEEAQRTQQRLHGELYIKSAEIRKITTIGRTKLYEMIKNGEFPKPINMRDDKDTTHKIWTASSVYNWMQQKAEERNQ